MLMEARPTGGSVLLIRAIRLISAESSRTATPAATTTRRALMGWPLSAVSNIA